jgi:hypothetical protein
LWVALSANSIVLLFLHFLRLWADTSSAKL